MQLTSTVECTHWSLLEGLWLHRSLHQDERLLKYNRKGRITQNTAEHAEHSERKQCIQILKSSVSVMTLYTYVLHASWQPEDQNVTLYYLTFYITLILHFSLLPWHFATCTVCIYIIIAYHCAVNRYQYCFHQLQLQTLSLGGWRMSGCLTQGGPGPYARAMLTQHTRKTSWWPSKGQCGESLVMVSYTHTGEKILRC